MKFKIVFEPDNQSPFLLYKKDGGHWFGGFFADWWFMGPHATFDDAFNRAERLDREHKERAKHLKKTTKHTVKVFDFDTDYGV